MSDAYKPTREFSANVGDYSVDIAGPDAIENDIDSIMRMFDPETEHAPGIPGGIGTGNIQTGAGTDEIIGERTISQDISDAYTNTGFITKLLSLLAKAIKALKGTANWYTPTSDSIEGLHTRVTTNKDNITINTNAIANHKTSGDHDGRYYTENEIDAKVSNINSSINATNANLSNHKTSGDHDIRYYPKSQIDATVATLATKAENALKANSADVYTKTQLEPYLRGGDTVIRREVFIIVNSNNGDGTFTYKDVNDIEHIGELGASGEQIFTLQKGNYALGEERIEATVNDTLQRSVTSGGLQEIDSTHVALTMPEGNGAEITIKYFESIGVTGLGLIQRSATEPPIDVYWFEVVG